MHICCPANPFIIDICTILRIYFVWKDEEQYSTGRVDQSCYKLGPHLIASQTSAQSCANGKRMGLYVCPVVTPLGTLAMALKPRQAGVNVISHATGLIPAGSAHPRKSALRLGGTRPR